MEMYYTVNIHIKIQNMWLPADELSKTYAIPIAHVWQFTIRYIRLPNWNIIDGTLFVKQVAFEFHWKLDSKHFRVI